MRRRQSGPLRAIVQWFAGNSVTPRRSNIIKFIKFEIAFEIICAHSRMESDDGRPPVPTLLSSAHQSLRVGNASENCEKESARLRSHDDADSSSAEDSPQASKGSGTSGSATSTASQDPDCSNEWMFHGNVALPCCTIKNVALSGLGIIIAGVVKCEELLGGFTFNVTIL